ncbi:MAG: hypothetical protein NBV67_02400 [Tagaea sp.]|nr:hypothetical protein [Tagaea sp.]
MPSARSIRPRVRQAVELFATGQADSIKDAAEKVGMRREALSRAFHRQDVQDLLDARLKSFRSIHAKARAQHAVVFLSENAKSEDVRFRSSQWIEQTTGMVDASRRARDDSPGGVVGGTFMLNLVFKGDAAAQNGAPGVQSATLIEQRVEAVERSEPARVLAKVVVGAGGEGETPGGRDGDR